MQEEDRRSIRRPSLAADVGALAAAEAVARLGTLALLVVAGRTLSPPEFAVYNFGLSLALLLSAAPAFGFYALLVQRGSSQPAHLQPLAAETLVLQCLLGFPVYAVAAVLAVVLMPDRHAAVVVLMLAAILLEIIMDSARATCAIRGRQRDVAVALVTQRMATAAVGSAYLLLTGDVVGLAAAYVVGAAAGAWTLLRAARRLGVRLGPSAIRADRAGLRETARRSVPAGLETLAGMVLFRADMVLLGLLAPQEELAAYAVTYRLLEAALFLAYVAGRAVLPRMSAAPLSLLPLLGRTLGACAAVYAIFAAVALTRPDDAIRLVFGEAHVSAASVDALRLVALAPLLYATAAVAAQALFALDAWRLTFRVTATAAAVSVVLDLALIPSFGARAAAAVTTACYGLQAALALAAVARLAGRPRLFRPVLPAIAGSVALAAWLGLSAGSFVLDLATGLLLHAAVWFIVASWSEPALVRRLSALIRR